MRRSNASSSPGLHSPPTACFPETCMRLLQNPTARRDLAEAGFDRIAALPQTEYLRRALFIAAVRRVHEFIDDFGFAARCRPEHARLRIAGCCLGLYASGLYHCGDVGALVGEHGLEVGGGADPHHLTEVRQPLGGHLGCDCTHVGGDAVTQCDRHVAPAEEALKSLGHDVGEAGFGGGRNVRRAGRPLRLVTARICTLPPWSSPSAEGDRWRPRRCVPRRRPAARD